MVANLLEGLPVPDVLSPSNNLLEWNVHLSSRIEALYGFASAYLYEDVCMFVFLPKVKEARHVMTWVETYDFVIKTDWWGHQQVVIILWS